MIPKVTALMKSDVISLQVFVDEFSCIGCRNCKGEVTYDAKRISL